MPYQDLPGLGMRGLNKDTPSQALDHTHFSNGTNMRPFDGSLQSVFEFRGVDANVTPSNRLDLYALTGWVETGVNELRLAYIYKDGDEYNFQIIDDLTSDSNIVSGSHATTNLTENPRWGIQLLPFNGILIANDSVNQPIVISYDDTEDEYRSDYVLGWLSQGSDNDDYDDSDINAYNQANQRDADDRVVCERMIAYNNRLIALNIQGNYINDDSDSTGLGNASIVWSTPISQLESLNGVTFRFSSSNSAGDDILTETPGEVLDGGVCGQYLVIYKDDAVYRYTDVGDPLYLVGEVIFSDDGLYSPDCFSDIGQGRHLVVGNYGVYIHDAGPNRQNISRGRVEKSLYSDIDSAYKDNTFTFHHETDSEVWICYPSVDADETLKEEGGCDKAYVYNYAQDVWYTRDIGLGGGIPYADALADSLELNTLVIFENRLYEYIRATTLEPWDPTSAYNSNAVVSFNQRIYDAEEGFTILAADEWDEDTAYNEAASVAYNGRRYFTDGDTNIPAGTLPTTENSGWVDHSPDVFSTVWDDETVEHGPGGTNSFFSLADPRGYRGISAFHKDGELFIYGFSDRGATRLSDERQSNPVYRGGSVEFHYLDMGDPSKVKHLKAVYPHTMDSCEVHIDSTNDLGTANEPNFDDNTHQRVFDSDAEYKLDYRTHGRYFHIELSAHEDNNPQITSAGIEMKIGGQR